MVGSPGYLGWAGLFRSACGTEIGVREVGRACEVAMGPTRSGQFQGRRDWWGGDFTVAGAKAQQERSGADPQR